MEGTVRNWLKNSFFFYFVANFWDKRSKLVIRKVKGGVPMSQEQIGEFPLLSPGNWAFFSFSPNFPPVPPKNGALPPS